MVVYILWSHFFPYCKWMGKYESIEGSLHNLYMKAGKGDIQYVILFIQGVPEKRVQKFESLYLSWKSSYSNCFVLQIMIHMISTVVCYIKKSDTKFLIWYIMVKNHLRRFKVQITVHEFIQPAWNKQSSYIVLFYSLGPK